MTHLSSRRKNSANGLTAEVLGGFGNQLFIYATAFELSRELQCPLYLDSTWYIKNVDRSFSLGAFESTFIEIQSNPMGRQLAIRIQESPVRAMKHRILRNTPRLTGHTFVESGFEFDPRVRLLPVGTRLRGYFQSWRYFEDSASLIRSQMNSLKNPSAWYREQSELISHGKNWVGLHVRRGDYLHPETREVHGIVGSDYYQQALRIVDAIHGDMEIKVFSDDVDSARKLLENFDRPMQFIQPSLDSSPLENVLLLSKANAIVTANSSFSWWAAWLGHGPDSTVVVPKRWFNTKPCVEKDLFLPSWIVI